jgi:hypothetical protein
LTERNSTVTLAAGEVADRVDGTSAEAVLSVSECAPAVALAYPVML